MISNKGVNMLMETNHNPNNTFVPKMIKWDDVLIKDDWHFDSITEPEIEKENSNIDQIPICSQVSSSRRMSFSRPSFSITKEEDEISLEDIDKKLKWVYCSETIFKVELNFRNSKPIKSASPTAS
ncbi:hypothetical protein H5410_014886 [Solanum commersonii]|uniref:Uncharacterized protein n=1 Tax=Solanum commersonii TaxID=4109 RepID=A0A9J5ZS69_SOLCO|nr:hypothetical protein H5410_014886 [Solanum commersonii]